MNATLHNAAVFCLGALTATSAGAADTLRCNGSLISTGASMAEVEARCGMPDSREVERIPIRGRSANGASIELGTTTIEHWTYERGLQLPARLTFDESTLERIEYLTRR